MAPQLQAHINEMQNLPLDEAIQSIIDLLPGLEGSVSPKYIYLIKHPDYEGEADLNASRQPTRLLHNSLNGPLTDFYGDLYTIMKEGYRNGTMVPEPSEDRDCACCRGDPDAVILAGFHDGKAFLYEEQDYRDIWGEQQDYGSCTTGWTDEDGVQQSKYEIYASKEQVEEALKDAEELQAQEWAFDLLI
ncbi:hypothetical protein N7478_005835 [Penicillium angulare]|uniref:uncharacterized protein n=1 Tax=Penicillium angulare TaxID=116970 RepID=UPI0025409502|nr:uncharacterized protein N7478_005835 [Penicillium angulare]KAJ5280463.1 hypothetical protein N7478_005835 [Penicillium angulare]